MEDQEISLLVSTDEFQILAGNEGLRAWQTVAAGGNPHHFPVFDLYEARGGRDPQCLVLVWSSATALTFKLGRPS